MDIPKNLHHKPIVGVNYEKRDEQSGGGDAFYLSIGKAQWNQEDISAKVIRWTGSKWSRQSEELPLWRVLDLAQFLIASISNQKSTLNEEEVSDKEDVELLKNFIKENLNVYIPRLNEIRRLLDNTLIKDCGKRPNIFSYATSELSQDAFLCWLIRLADDEFSGSNEDLHQVGLQFVNLLTGIEKSEIHKVVVGRQWENIDIWVEINDDAILIIEDKTGSSIHDNQLERYKATVEREYKGKRDKQYYAYVKTGNEPKTVTSIVKNNGYKLISRQDILSILDEYNGIDPLLVDFRKHIQEIEDMTESFRSLPVDQWGWYAWQGFYIQLEHFIDDIDWSYVANPSGGFLGAWWHQVDSQDGNVQMYLQFEEQKLCFKIWYEGDNRSETRDRYRQALLENSVHNPEIIKPKRLGAGTYMTIAVVNAEDLFGTSVINIESIVSKLRQYEKIIETVMANNN